MQLDPLALSPADRYKLLIGCIIPRPIAFVSTVSPDGKFNLAPFSFCTGIGSDPMSILFCPTNGPGGQKKDSLRNCDFPEHGGTGQFVVNIASEPYERKMAAAAETLPYGASEFDLVGLTPAPSVRVKPPRLAESPASFECETMQIIALNPGVQGGGNIVIGRVVHIHLADDLVNERLHVDPDRLRAIGRLGGLAYCRTTDRFDMPMGRAALDGLPAQ
jgi:flavin reductase (DIM6/NTAB) family NADH-FMN oxidoreductase RutF